ncbi:hypothetical protein niasHT_033875 [Heterodera trifolii]|uniref:Ubiquitin-like domain-containing protein n=1 Tax=Heterodera trifolii TaxID=157864 RepID=A0ABD2I847_9BILA
MASSYAVQSINIFVKYENWLYDFHVLFTDTIKSLKEKIHKKVGILPEHQLLKHSILHRSIPDENVTVSSYGIKSLSELSLTLKEKFEIDVKYNGKKYAIAVEATEKVSSLKTKTKKTIKEEENIQLKNISLLCNGNPLADSQRVKNVYEECIGRGAISVTGEE